MVSAAAVAAETSASFVVVAVQNWRNLPWPFSAAYWLPRLAAAAAEERLWVA